LPRLPAVDRISSRPPSSGRVPGRATPSQLGLDARLVRPWPPGSAREYGPNAGSWRRAGRANRDRGELFRACLARTAAAAPLRGGAACPCLEFGIFGRCLWRVRAALSCSVRAVQRAAVSTSLLLLGAHEPGRRGEAGPSTSCGPLAVADTLTGRTAAGPCSSPGDVLRPGCGRCRVALGGLELVGQDLVGGAGGVGLRPAVSPRPRGGDQPRAVATGSGRRAARGGPPAARGGLAAPVAFLRAASARSTARLASPARRHPGEAISAGQAVWPGRPRAVRRQPPTRKTAQPGQNGGYPAISAIGTRGSPSPPTATNGQIAQRPRPFREPAASTAESGRTGQTFR